MPNITETLKQKLDELDLDRRVDDLYVHAEKAVGVALDKAGTVATDKRENIDGFLAKAETALNERTEGKYSDQVTRVAAQVRTGLTKLAERNGTHSDRAAEDPDDSPISSWDKHTDDV